MWGYNCGSEDGPHIFLALSHQSSLDDQLATNLMHTQPRRWLGIESRLHYPAAKNLALLLKLPKIAAIIHSFVTKTKQTWATQQSAHGLSRVALLKAAGAHGIR